MIKWIDYDEDGRISLKDYLEGCRKIPFLMACFQASGPVSLSVMPLIPDSSLASCYSRPLLPVIRTDYDRFFVPVSRLFVLLISAYSYPFFPLIRTSYFRLFVLLISVDLYRLLLFFVPLTTVIRAA